MSSSGYNRRDLRREYNNSYGFNFMSHLDSKRKKRNYKVFKDLSELKRAIDNVPKAGNFYNLNRIKYNHAMKSFHSFINSTDEAASENFNIPVATSSENTMLRHNSSISDKVSRSNSRLEKCSTNRGRRILCDTCNDSNYLGAKPHCQNLIDLSFFQKINGKSTGQNEENENLTAPYEGAQTGNNNLTSDKQNDKVINRFNNLLQNINCIATEITNDQTNQDTLMKNIISNNIVQRASNRCTVQCKVSDYLRYLKKRTASESITSHRNNATTSNVNVQ